MSTTKNYIKGIFAKSLETKFGALVNLDINDDAIEQLKSLPKNERGMRRLTMSPQKNDNTKWSVYENDYIPKSNAGPNSNSSSEEGSDLPF